MNILEARRRTLGGRTIKRTAAGNPAVAQGSLARRGPGITMQGWTEQDSTTGAQLWDEANEVEYGNGRRYVFHCEPNTNYTFSTDIQVSSLGVWSDGFDGENLHAVKYSATELTFNSGEYNTLYMQVYEPENPGGIKVMLNAGSAALPYELYTGGQPSPSPDYPQEIVSAGSWNETAQKWEYEVGLSGANMLDTGNEFPYKSGRRFAFNCIPNTDYTLHSGIVVRSIGVLTNEFTDINNPYAVVYSSDTLVFNSGNNEILYIQFYSPGVDLDYEVMLNPGSTPLPYTPYRPPQTVTITADRPLTKWDRLEKRGGQWGWVYKSEEIESYTDESVPGEYYSTTGQLSAGAQVWYETDTETFVPLTTAEQEAMNALYTYRPTTVLSNQQGCQMTLTYKTREGVGGGNLLDYRKLVNPAYWIGTTPTNPYKYFDIALKNNTKYRLSCTENNMNKNYVTKHPIGFEITFYVGENPGGFVNNVGFGHTGLNKGILTEYEFTTTENPYYFNLYIDGGAFTQENLHIVFDELLPGLKLQEVN